MAIHPLWAQYPDIQKELEQTQKPSNMPLKFEIRISKRYCHNFSNHGGKLLRPAFLFFLQSLALFLLKKKT